jgi:hypothetical protein
VEPSIRAAALAEEQQSGVGQWREEDKKRWKKALGWAHWGERISGTKTWTALPASKSAGPTPNQLGATWKLLEARSLHSQEDRRRRGRMVRLLEEQPGRSELCACWNGRTRRSR